MLEVANALIRDLLIPNRIKAQEDRTRIGDGQDAMALYRESIRDMQQRLVDLGFLKGGVDGAYGPGTSAAVGAFQKAAGLPSYRQSGRAHADRPVLQRAAAREWRRPPERPVGRTRGSTGRLACRDPCTGRANRRPSSTSTSHRRRNSLARSDRGAAAHIPPT